MQKKASQGFRLSPQQEHLWSLCRLDHDLPYRAQCVVLIEGSLRIDALKAAVQQVVNRHEILRTTFHRLRGMSAPLQVIMDSCEVSMDEADLSGLGPLEQEAEVETLFHRIGQAPFDLEQGPVIHSALAVLSPSKRMLIVSLPALNADAVALNNLVCEISRCCSAFLRGTAVAEQPTQYAELSEWQNELLEAEDTRSGVKFWSGLNLSALDALKLPLEDRLGIKPAFRPHCVTLAIEPDVSATVGMLAQEFDVSTQAFLLACWQALLWRLTGEPEVIVGTYCDGRKYEELQQAQGPFARYLPLGCHLDYDSQLIEVMQRVEESLSENYRWQEYFTWRGIEALKGDDSAGRFFPFAFDFQQLPATCSGGGATFSIHKQRAYIDRFKVRLSCVFGPDLMAELHYDSALYEPQEIQRLAGQFHTLLKSAADNPTSAIGELEILSEQERRQLLVEFNSARAAYPKDYCVHQLIEQQAELTPDSAAVVFEDRSLTFAELNARANHLAHHLRALGVGPDVPVAIFLERSLEIVIALVGILKAGGAYMAIDPAQPRQRVEFMIKDAEASVLLTERRLLETLLPCPAEAVCLDAQWDVIARQSGDNLDGGARPENLAYVIYTSGSTGPPKGVAVEHRQLLNYLNAILERLELPAGASFATVSTFAADLGNTVIFPSLCTGGSLHVISQDLASDPTALADYFRRNPIDCLKIVPSHLAALLTSSRPEEMLPKRRLVVGGEAASRGLVEQLQSLAPDCALMNHYGPTETTVGVMTYEVEKGHAASLSATLPLGRPLSNAEVYVLDSRLQPVPVGLSGEAHIGGANLARGYLNRADLTAEKFIPNPFSDRPGQRLYKTGDLARFLPGGELEFLGRIDNQVKLRGFRIELGEIESVLNQHRAVEKAVVLAREDQPGNKRLVAYVAPGRKYAPTIEGRPRYRLPNGMAIVQQNNNETDYNYREIFEQKNYFRHGVGLSDGGCVLDVGANIGLFTLFVSRHYPRARVYAFEPIKPLYETLRINAELYGSQVKLFQFGLGDRERVDNFTYYPGYSVMSGLGAYASREDEIKTVKTILRNNRQYDAPGGADLLEYADDLLEGHFESESVACRVRTLSDVIREEGIERIDLLKIDVQRAELDVLRGIRQQDWEKIGQIVMEVHDGQGRATEGRLGEIITLLEGRGFEVVAQQDELLKGTDRHNLYAVRRGEQASAHAQDDPADIDQPSSAVADSHVLSAGDLADFLKERLPDYMVPSAFLILDRLPLTANGKIDRQALPAPEQAQSTSAPSYVAPRTHAEETLARIWAQVLGIRKVGVHENFFELGGDSIISIQIIARANQEGLHLTPRQIFQHKTIAELAAVAGGPSAAEAEQGPVTGPLPLTPIQHWFFEQNLPAPSHWNMSAFLEVKQAAGPAVFNNAVRHLLLHHDALRLRFRREESGWQQESAPPGEAVPFTLLDLSCLPEAEQVIAMERAAAQLQAALSLTDGPLIRVGLFNFGADNPARLLTVIHHLAVDGVSWRILLEDLQAVYEQLRADEQAHLPPKTTSFQYWSTRLVEYAQTAALRQELDYWLAQTGDDVSGIPVDFAGGANTVASADIVSVSLGAEETQSLLQDVPQAYHTQINDLLLTALAQAFRQWTGATALLIDLEGHGREEIFDDLDLSRTVGWFTTRFPVLLDLKEISAPGESLKLIKELLRGVPGRGIGYGLLRYLTEDQQVAKRLREVPEPEVSFNYLGQFDQLLPPTSPFQPARESVGPARNTAGTRRYLLDVNAEVTGGQLRLAWGYSEAIHRRETIERLAQSFIESLRALITHCLSPDAGGYTPSDFQEFGWTQKDLDDIIAKIS